MSIKRPGVRVATLLALLLSMAIPTGLAFAETTAPTRTAVISDGSSLGDTITITIEDVPAQPAGTALEGWLVSDDGSVYLSTGILTIDDGDDVSQSYVSPTGENLIESYNKFLVTVEPVPDSDAAPSSEVAFSHRIPRSAMSHIRHLLVSWPAGSDKGVITSLKEELANAKAHAQAAIEASTLADIQSSTEKAIEAIDVAVQHAADSEHASFASTEAPDDTVISKHAGLAEASGGNAGTWAGQARDAAVLSLAQTTMFNARLQLNPVIGYLTSALSGVDADADGTISSGGAEGGANQAYTEAQLMATYTLSEGALAPIGPELGVGLSNTGDGSVATMVLIALAASAAMMFGGGAFILKGRRIRDDR